MTIWLHRICQLFALALVVGSTGCASLISMAGWSNTDQDTPLIYGGVVTDTLIIDQALSREQPVLLGLAAAVDLPLSAVIDTVFLPITLSIYLCRDEPYGQAAKQSSQ